MRTTGRIIISTLLYCFVFGSTIASASDSPSFLTKGFNKINANFSIVKYRGGLHPVSSDILPREYPNAASQTTPDDPSSPPTPPVNTGDIVDIGAAFYNTYALKRDGTLWGWGENSYYELGLGVRGSFHSPTEITTISGVNSVITSSYQRRAFVEKGLNYYGMGSNNYYTLGNSTGNLTTPTLHSGITGLVQVSMGYEHAIGLMQDGRVMAWGRNTFGEVTGASTGIANISDPIIVPGLENVKQVAAGSQYSVVVMNDGTVMAWGSNSGYRLGLPSGTRNSPTVVPELTNVKYVAVEYDTGFALLNDGTVMSWGNNQSGQAGHGSSPKTIMSPTLIAGLTDVKDIVTSRGYAFAILEDGTVKAWGVNGNNGQLGLGDTVARYTPVEVPGLFGSKKIALGNGHGIALMEDGSLKVWGYNLQGQLGLGDTTRRLSPVTLEIVR